VFRIARLPPVARATGGMSVAHGQGSVVRPASCRLISACLGYAPLAAMAGGALVLTMPMACLY
jgi:hypothetical protein